MLFRIKNKVSSIFKNQRTPYILVLLAVVFHFFYLDVIWNGSDSTTFLTVGASQMIPQHTILYPVLIHLIKAVTNSEFQLILILKILQNGLLLLSIFYLLFNVSEKLKIALIICSLYIFFIVQNGIFTEGFHVSFMILFLTSSWILYKKKKFKQIEFLLFLFSFMGLLLTRHTGILFLIFPLLLFIEFKLYSIKLILSTTFGLLTVLFISTLTSNFTKSQLKAIEVPMYGRPAMHIISKTLTNNKNRKSIIIHKWMNKATSEEQKQTQIFISQENSGGIWLIPRQNTFEYLRKKYPKLDSVQTELKTEFLINQAYINFVKTADIGLFKQYFFTSSLLIVASPFSSYSLIEKDLKTKKNNLFHNFSFQKTGWINYFILSCGVLAQIVIYIYLLWIVIKAFMKKRLNHFGVMAILFFAIQLITHAITTVYIARYSITFIMLVLFCFISLIESHKNTKNSNI